MALQDYLIQGDPDDPEDVYPDGEMFLDDLAANGGLPGTRTSGRSDEYIGFEGTEKKSGYEIYWYLYLRPDAWDAMIDDTEFWTDFDFSLTINFDDINVNEEILTFIKKVANTRFEDLGYPYISGYLTDGKFVDAVPKVGNIINGIEYELQGSVNYRGSLEDKWDINKVANYIKTDKRKFLDQIGSIALEILDLVNTWQA